jgi:hypothetical protein
MEEKKYSVKELAEIFEKMPADHLFFTKLGIGLEVFKPDEPVDMAIIGATRARMGTTEDPDLIKALVAWNWDSHPPHTDDAILVQKLSKKWIVVIIILAFVLLPGKNPGWQEEKWHFGNIYYLTSDPSDKYPCFNSGGLPQASNEIIYNSFFLRLYITGEYCQQFCYASNNVTFHIKDIFKTGYSLLYFKLSKTQIYFSLLNRWFDPVIILEDISCLERE